MQKTQWAMIGVLFVLLLCLAMAWPDPTIKLGTPLFISGPNGRKHMSQVDPTTNDVLVYAPMEDLDVSYDGKTWFHLVGPSCSKVRPSLSISR